MNSAYRILKLKSGEDLIAKILKKENDKIILESPMAFRSMLITDPYTGTQKEITILRDWISYSMEKEVKIPQDFVLAYVVPAEEAKELYDKEKEKKKTNKTKKIQNIENVKNDMQKEADSVIQNLIDSILQKKKTEDGPLFFNQMSEEMFESMINSMNEHGEFEFEFDMTFPAEEISDETTEEEINHPDYGNRWTDWSSDIRDY